MLPLSTNKTPMRVPNPARQFYDFVVIGRLWPAIRVDRIIDRRHCILRRKCAQSYPKFCRLIHRLFTAKIAFKPLNYKQKDRDNSPY